MMVEMLGGFMAVCTYLRYGMTIEGVVYYAFIAALLVVIFIDIDHQIIPDVISLGGIPIGFIAASFLIPSVSWLDALIGVVLGGGTLYLVAWSYMRITGVVGMGLGDVKLLAMIGAFIGWQVVLLTIFTSSGIGTLVGLADMLAKKKNMKMRIPFGPFLAMGAIIHLFWGREIIAWYLNTL